MKTSLHLARCPVCGWSAPTFPCLPVTLSLWAQEYEWIRHLRGTQHQKVAA